MWTNIKADFAPACEVLSGWFWPMTSSPLGCIATHCHTGHIIELPHKLTELPMGLILSQMRVSKREGWLGWKEEDLYEDRSSVSVRRPPMRPPRSSWPPLWELWNTSKDGGQPIWVSAPCWWKLKTCEKVATVNHWKSYNSHSKI